MSFVFILDAGNQAEVFFTRIFGVGTMDSEDISKILEYRIGKGWYISKPAAKKAAERLENQYGIILPGDYKKILEISNGGGFEGDRTDVYFEDVDFLEQQEDEYPRSPDFPPIFIFGNNGGGWVYFFDINNFFGKGENSICMCHMGSLFPQYVVYVADTLTDMVKQIIAGEEFVERPYILKH
jgi:hypothetical protein